MQDYRAYILGPDGHVQNRVNLLYDDEAEAIRLAKQLVDGRDVELWQLGRKIETFKDGVERPEPDLIDIHALTARSGTWQEITELRSRSLISRLGLTPELQVAVCGATVCSQSCSDLLLAASRLQTLPQLLSKRFDERL
ncbi:hypothetical protein ACFIOY_35585 [Bradyrhizobium sp. TZ2]